MATQPFQVTFHMGSNSKGKMIFDLHEENKKKVSAKDGETLRVATRILNKLPKTDPIFKQAMIEEGLS